MRPCSHRAASTGCNRSAVATGSSSRKQYVIDWPACALAIFLSTARVAARRGQSADGVDALGGLQTWPRPGVECGPCDLVGPGQIVGSGGRDLGHRRFGVRRDDLDAPVSARLRPVAADEQLIPPQPKVSLRTGTTSIPT